MHNRVKVRHLVQDHLPNFVKENFPEFQGFLRSYYGSLESPGGPTDILNNIDQYVKLENLSELVYSTTTTSDSDLFSNTIEVENTQGFPDNNGLIQIDSEIITYESKTPVSFVNCSRGFSGITSYKGQEDDSLIFSQTGVSTHASSTVVYNLHALFLFELYRKFKRQYTPGFEEVKFFDAVNEKNIVSRLKDFYSAKGSTSSFDILFKVIFGVDVSIVKPRDFLLQASDADYRIVRDLVVKQLQGDPNDLVNRTLFQDETEHIVKATGSITAVEEIIKDGMSYFRLSLDYNPDLEQFKFSVHPKTRITEAVGLNQVWIDVDSTISFPDSGVLTVTVDGVDYEIEYTSKSSTQFFGLSSPIPIPVETNVETPDFAYAINSAGEEIRVKISGVLGTLTFDRQASNYYQEGDQVEIVSLGHDSQDQILKSWILNITPEYDIAGIVKLTNAINGAAQYRLTTFDDHIFTLGDIGTLTANDGTVYDISVLGVADNKSFDVNLPANIPLINVSYIVRRGISKVAAVNLPELANMSANMQNMYIDDSKNTYAVSPSLPDYFNTPIDPKPLSMLFSGQFNGYQMAIGSNPFFTGDPVWYSANNNIPLSIPEGQYFIKKVNASTISLATSKSNIRNGIFVRVFGTVTNNKLELLDFRGKSLKRQDLVRKFTKPKLGGRPVDTTSGQTGMFVNGVELTNYKSSDLVYYGQIDEIEVTSSGDSNYDVINPPALHIEDGVGAGTTNVGVGATGVCNINGSLKRIDVIETGFDYTIIPKVTITGGQGTGAEAQCSVSNVTHRVTFNAGAEYIDIDLANNKIGFSTYHKLRPQEEVIYKSEGQTVIGGLVNQSIYFANLVDEFSIKLHSTLDDAIAGVNTVGLSTYGSGLQTIEAFEKKKVISSIEVVNAGYDYRNKTLYFQPSKVDIFDNKLNIDNHKLKDREVVQFINEGGAFPVGVASTTQYYVSVVDENSVRLAERRIVSTGDSISEDYNYINNRFLDFADNGTGIHKLVYTPIEVKIEGPIGVGTFAGQDFRAKINPVFTGDIESISLSAHGENYGDNEILNYNRQPVITLINGENAQVSPLVSSEGKIIDIIINNQGSGYNSPPIIEIEGDGNGAILNPIIIEGKLVDVKIINNGFGYKNTNTFLNVVATGSGAKFNAKIKSWTINLVQKLMLTGEVPQDDGVLALSLDSSNEIEYTHAFAPRELRRKVLATSVDIDGSIIYRADILNETNTNKYHSPIIGWAFDGFPIYGPYGYADREGGAVKRLETSYELRVDVSGIRPPSYGSGMFCEDYKYVGKGDLDEFNGRFCKTPEFPNGTYAYFLTVDASAEVAGPFAGYLKPVFPYVIGPQYKGLPQTYNFSQFSTLRFVDLNDGNYTRYTSRYGIRGKKSRYKGFIQPNVFSEGFTEVVAVSPGSVDSLNIIAPGDKYNIADNIFFNDEGTQGGGAYARISQILGPSVTNIAYNTKKLSNIQFTPTLGKGRFVGFGTTAHEFNSGDIVDLQNLNLLSTELSKNYTVGVTTNTLVLRGNVGTANSTGITTYFNVDGDLTFPTTVVDDFYTINSEIIQILNIDTVSKRIRVRRDIAGVATAFAHQSGDILSENPRRFTINTGFQTTTQYQIDRTLYFEPEEVTGLISENLVLYSDAVSPSLTGGTWTKATAGNGIGTVTFYHSKTPDGNIAAAKVGIATTTSATDTVVLQNGNFTLSGNVHTFSAFLKGDQGGEEVWMILQDTAVNVYYHQKVTLTREWQRFKLTTLTNANPHRAQFGANGVAVGSGTTIRATLNARPTFYVAGVQVEQSEFMTPYVATYDTQVLASAKKVGKTYLQNPGAGIDKISPIKDTFYIPGHGLRTGEKIIYNVGAGSSGPNVSAAGTSYWLTDNTTLYAAVHDENFVGISTNKIGIGTTGNFVGIGSTATVGLLTIDTPGSGRLHSFKTSYNNVISADILKKTATVSTGASHYLTDGDYIDLKVTSGIQTTVTIKYDDGNRRMLVNPRGFLAGDVDEDNNRFTITNHGWRTGDKILHNSSTPTGGINNSQIYYIIVIDENTVKLSDNYYSKITSDDEIQIVGITSASFGTFSPINPEIKAYRNNTIVFDLSDSSLSNSGLSAFDFNIYRDSDFSDLYFTSEANAGISTLVLDFHVKKNGVIGQQNANLTLVIDKSTPNNLYYNLEPIKSSGAAASKTEMLSDNFQITNPNRLSIVDSKYDAKITVSGLTTNTFNYTLYQTPEKPSYDATEATVVYQTTSKSATGPVGDIALDSGGSGYKSLPYVSKVVSAAGTGALFLPRSTSIGKLNEVVLTDIGFDYPADNTLRPAASLPATYKIEPLSKFKKVKLQDPGVNYFLTPDIVVVDGFTGRVNTEAFLRYDVGDTEIEIVRNTTGLYNVTPVLMPTNNPNGTRIDSIVFDSTTLDVTVAFAVTFSSAESYPFEVGGRILVENTNTLNDVGRGYNSAAYDYKLFTITAADANIGGDFPTLKYNLTGLLNPGEQPGDFDNFESFGTVTPESYFPTFEVFLEKDSFARGEFITNQLDNSGVVQEYDNKNEFLKVRSQDQFNKGDVIIGQSTQNQGLISSVDGVRGTYSINSNSVTKKGFLKDTGKLNRFFQRMHDNDYYQYFSYAVRSPISFEKWNAYVSNLNHTTGYKKFGELLADSYDPAIVGMGTGQDLNAFIAVSDLTSVVDLNMIKDFDTAREKAITVNNKLVSNEILFGLPFLAKYQEFIGNRVLPIDDFSVDFDGTKRDFGLFCAGDPIFEQTFDGSDTSIVDVNEQSVNLFNHYFVSGEKIEYIPHGNDFANAINIDPTDFGPGIGTTTKLPGSFHVIKLDNQKIQVAVSATDSLRFNPVYVGINSVGIGTQHKFRGVDPNNRLLITVNGTIQSPVVSTANTFAVGSTSVGIGTTIFGITGISSVFSGDLVKVNDETMLVAGVDKPNNLLTVRRGWMGSTEATHTGLSTVTKLVGNFSVVNNDIHFSEAMWGDIPVGMGTTGTSNNIDYTGLTTSSRFSGRVFLRSAINEAFTTSFVKAYDNNFVFDDLSSKFNGISTSFILQNKGNDIDTITAGNAIILINDIFQGPQRLGNEITTIEGDYKIEQHNGNTQTLLGFNGKVSDYSSNKDINANNVPRGGIIVSVGSTDGYGFQPLVAAGGTAVVSSAGTITSIAIGNTGSGYRSGLQTVGVAVQTKSLGIASITYVGNATVTDGHVTDVTVDKVARFYKPRNIIHVGYSSVTGITTVRTTQKHQLELGDEVQIVGAAFTCDYYNSVDLTNAIYNNTTGIMTVSVATTSVAISDFVYTNTTGIATITTATPHNLVKQTAIGRTFALSGIALTCVGYGQTFAVHSAQYDHTTGLATFFTVGNHGLTATDDVKLRELNFTCPVGGAEGYGQQFGINGFTYDNLTGLCTVTTATSISGVIGVGSEVRLDNIGLNCAYGNSLYPDGSQGYTFSVLTVPTSNQFTFNAGVSTLPHTYVSGGTVNAGITTSVFPDGSQGYSFKTIGVAATSFTANVGISSIRHTWNNGGVVQVGITTSIFPGNAQNSPTGDTFACISAPDMYTLTFQAGISTIPHSYVSGGEVILGHKLKVGTDIALTGLGMTCGMSTEVHTYPRNRDTITDTSVEIIADGTDHTVTNAAYNPTTGIMTLTINNHGFHVGDKVKLAEKSLTFTCAKNNHASTHSYPRKNDPIYGQWVGIANTTVNTLKIQVLETIPSTNVDAHTFVSATTNGLTHNNNTITLDVGPSGPKHQFSHTFEGTDTFTPTAAAYNPNTGVMTLTIANHPFQAGDYVGIAQSALTFTCTAGSGNHAYPRATDPIYDKWIPVSNITTDTFDVQVLDTIPSTNVGVHTFVSATTGGISRSVVHTGGVYNHLFVSAEGDAISVGGTNTKYTPTNAEYTASNGNLVLTIPGHNLSGAATTTATGAQYDGNVGILTCTVSGGHNITSGQWIKFVDNSLTFKCALDSYSKNHTYPRPHDPAGTNWLQANVTSGTTFEVQVLESIPSTNTSIHTFQGAAANGIMIAQNTIGIATESIKLSCDMDKHGSEHVYPRRTDPIYRKTIGVASTTSDTITVDVGISTIIPYGVSAASYDPASGALVLNVGSHNLSKGTTVKVATNSLVFTCSQDSDTTKHRYPRAGDPIYAGTKVTRINSNTEFEINVGVSNVPTYYKSGGYLEEIILAPRAVNNMPSSQDVGFDGTAVTNILDEYSFECDSGTSPYLHFYKRAGEVTKQVDVRFDSPLGYEDIPLIYSDDNDLVGLGTGASVDIEVSNVTGVANFEVNRFGYAYGSDDVLTVAIGGTVGIPTFATKTTNALVPVVSGGRYPHTFVGAANSAVISGGGYDHTWVSSLTNGVSVTGVGNFTPTDATYNPTTGDMVLTIAGHPYTTSQTVGFATGAITFNCMMDGQATLHSYPRPGDPVLGYGVTAITAKDTNTITVNVGASATVGHSVNNATYTPETGEMVLTIPNHGLKGSEDYTVTHALYNAGTGGMTLTLSGITTLNALNVGDRVRFDDNSVSFTCAMDGNSTTHSYPRATDPSSNKWLPVVGVTTSNIEVMVGASGTVYYTPVGADYNSITGYMTLAIGEHDLTGPSNHTVTNAIYDPMAGIMTCTVPSHGFSNGDRVKFEDGSISFSCNYGSGGTKSYPRSASIGSTITDPISGKFIVISGVTDDTFNVGVGTATLGINNPHTFVSAYQNGLQKAGEPVVIAPNSINFQCSQDNYTTTHQYPRPGTDPIAGVGTPITGVGNTTITLFVGIGTDSDHRFVAGLSSATNAVRTGGNYTHTFVSATTNGLRKAGASVRLSDNGLTFKCEMDDYASEHSYPRATKNVHKFVRALEDSIVPNTGNALKPTGASYNGVDGNLVLDFDFNYGHKFVAGSSNLDDAVTVGVWTGGDKLTPRDAQYNPVSGDLVLNFNNNYAHTFDAAGSTLTNAVTVGVWTGGTKLSPNFATYDPLSGELELTFVADHNLTTANTIGIATNSLAFKCARDDYATSKTYPRTTDPIHNLSTVAIASTTAKTFKVLVGKSNHNLTTSNTIGIATGSLAFTCSRDNYGSVQSYPRAKDPIHGLSNVAIAATTLDTITVNVGTSYHKLVAGSNTVGIITESMTFTCDLDDHRTEHSYPRTTDPAHNATIGIAATTPTSITINVGKSGISTADPYHNNAVSIGSTTENTISVNIGKAPAERRFKVIDADYNGFTGWLTLTVGQHSLHTGERVRLANESLLFTCSSDDYGSINPYPRQTDPIYGGVGIASTTPTTIKMNVGMAPVGKRYAHQFVGVGSYREFQLTVDETYASKFSGWNVGDFLVLDDITPYFNGIRRLFPLASNGDRISFFARANAGINLQSNLLVFVNDILQTPGEGYTFTGGSTLRFSEAPKGGVAGFTTLGDKCKLLMYTGTQTIDVREVDVLPTLKVGDDVQLYSDVDVTFNQDERLVMDVKSADTITTNNYAGQGVTPNELLQRPISWTKQDVDKIIDTNIVGKDRVYYEPVINPQTNILETVGVNSTSVFVYSLRSLFDDPKEAMLVGDREKMQIITQEPLVNATASCTISNGAVNAITVTNPGFGYTVAPEVTVQKPFDVVGVATAATATASIDSNGSITGIAVGMGGTGYIYGPLTSLTVAQNGIGFPFLESGLNTMSNAKLITYTGSGRGATANIEISTLNYEVSSVAIVEGGTGYQPGDQLAVEVYDNVGLGTTNRRWALTTPIKFNVGAIGSPEVMVAPPSRKLEEVPKTTIEGDYGIIVGIGTTTIVGVASTGITFDFYIPQDSKLKSGFSLVQSGIETGYLFNVTGTGVNGPVTTLRADNSVLGIGTTCMDATFEVAHYTHNTRFIPPEISGNSVGIATTVTTVVAKIANFTNVVGYGTTANYGDYTWGKVNLSIRLGTKQTFEAVHGTSQSGIGSNPVIRRKNPLRYKGYIIS